MESRQIVVKELAIRYYHAGPEVPAGGPVLVFLHGWRSESKLWEGTMEWLAAKGFASFAFDLPGFGGSETPHAAWTLKDYRDLVDAFVRKAGLKRIVLVGHSFGGRISIRLAADHPDYLAALILTGSHGFRDRSLARQAKVAAAKIVKPLFLLPALRPLRKKIYARMGAEDYVATPALRDTLVNVINEDLTEYLPRVNRPACLIWGADDRETPPDFGRRMEALIPGARLWILAGAGHFAFLDRPDDFRSILSAFLERFSAS